MLAREVTLEYVHTQRKQRNKRQSSIPFENLKISQEHCFASMLLINNNPKLENRAHIFFFVVVVK